MYNVEKQSIERMKTEPKGPGVTDRAFFFENVEMSPSSALGSGFRLSLV